MRPARRLPIAILASGAGTNAQAIIDAAAAGSIPVEVRRVVSDVPGAPVLDRARAAGIATLTLDRALHDRDAWEGHVVADLTARGVELVVLAGYMRICGPTFLAAFQGRTLNVHPSMLPRFPGANAIGAALAAGAGSTGVSVHWIDAGIDTGPVIAQVAVPIAQRDTRATLARRIQAVEHELLPQVVGRVARARLALGSPAFDPTDQHARTHAAPRSGRFVTTPHLASPSRTATITTTTTRQAGSAR